MPNQQLLKQYFGFDSFRGCQRAIVEHVVQGGHALVIAPTGMGKSLCYQLPALHFADRYEEEALASTQPLTLVISPLIALMKDQVDALLAKGIQATYINSSLNRREREARYRAVADGQYDLLYVTPERFRKPEFREVISKRTICLLAVDEAHCISEWGHDFRPDYTRIGEFRAFLDNPTTIALTATATPEVQQDIIRQLYLAPSEIQLFHEGIDRPNLRLDVEKVWGDDEKLEIIKRVNHDIPGSGIVYFTLIQTLLKFAGQLRKSNIPHLIYHGELPRLRRREVQEWFMADDHLVLATNAFGMGIDKESIRFVLHAELPGSMESYYQEIGRAGRDGLDSLCLLLYDQNDLHTQMEFIRWSNPDAEFYRRVYDFLTHDLEQVNAFGEDWLKERLHFKQRHDHRLETALSMLDRYGAVTGSIETGDLKVIDALPAALANEEQLAEKLQRDQQKLYSLIQFVHHEGDRKAFIHEYFGIPYEG